MMSKDAVRMLVYRQLKVEHPEYNEHKLRGEVDMISSLINQVQEAALYDNEATRSHYI